MDENKSKGMNVEAVEGKKINGTVVLMKKDMVEQLSDAKDELVGRKVCLRLISSVNCEPDGKGKLGKVAYLVPSLKTNKDMFQALCGCFDEVFHLLLSKFVTSKTEGDLTFDVAFDWDEGIGLPGAFTIRNLHHKEFYLKTLTLDVPNHGRVHFICNSWVYPDECYKKDRVFFSNKTYLPSQTPKALRPYREEEMKELRGNGTGKLEEWDRVYDFDVYNDLSEPDKGPEHIRPIMGGSPKHPYPRRGRTGRARTKTDPEMECRLPLLESLNIYVPRDERFSQIKMADVYAYGIKLILQALGPGFEALYDKISGKFDGTIHDVVKFKHDTPGDEKFDEFMSFEDVLKLYGRESKLPSRSLLEGIRKKAPTEMLKELFRSDGAKLSKFPMPQVIQEDKSAWNTDKEFAREMLAGLNPVVIRRLQEFPPTSKLDPSVYGNQNSTMTKEHIEDQLNGLDIDEAIKNNRLYILDHHDPLMPYLRRINETSTKTYATRTVLFLQEDGTLKPLAIELSLPHPDGDKYGRISTVHTPSKDGAEGTIWQLAKAYVAVNDSGYHQLICHWLHTHAAMEPFVIATHRQLSILHPIHKLLHPHFRDTMNINALSRQTLISAGGLLELTVFPAKYSMEMTVSMYKEWAFPDQALPTDLIKRGMAVKDTHSPHGIRLLIEDYPYAADGLEIWSAIKTWVTDYCSLYYKNNNEVQKDEELQNWWNEVRNKGHGDKKDATWWPEMHTLDELIDSCTIIIWIASALHAAVNFGQYPYGGYIPNRPATSRRFLPEPNTPDYKELETSPEKAFLKTVTPQLQGILGISLIEILSRHTSDEVFLGQRDTPEWTTDTKALEAFQKFGGKLAEIEKKIMKMNKNDSLKNRVGPIKMPYTLLYPSSGIGLTGKGIPNSVSI